MRTYSVAAGSRSIAQQLSRREAVEQARNYHVRLVATGKARFLGVDLVEAVSGAELATVVCE